MHEGKPIKFDSEPIYLGVTLDRSLSFGPHLKMVCEKVQKRVNLIRKLVGTGWGAGFRTLRTSTLALVFSAAEYAAPVWSHSTHVKYLDAVINVALRTISGAITSTPTVMLPVLAGIPPASIRRDCITLKYAEKSSEPGCLVPQPYVHYPLQRIKRHHFTTQVQHISSLAPWSQTWIEQRWSEEWKRHNTLTQVH